MIVRLGGEKRTNVVALVVSARDATADARRPSQPVDGSIGTAGALCERWWGCGDGCLCVGGNAACKGRRRVEFHGCALFFACLFVHVFLCVANKVE